MQYLAGCIEKVKWTSTASFNLLFSLMIGDGGIMWIISLSGWCTSLQIVGKYLGMDTGFARERVATDWIVSVLIGIFTCLFRLALIYFPLLRIVGITTCICECFILLKTRLCPRQWYSCTQLHLCIRYLILIWLSFFALSKYIEKCSCCL